jgi:hypothetical protein
MGYFADKMEKLSGAFHSAVETGKVIVQNIPVLAKDAKANPGHFANGVNNGILSGVAMVAGAPVDAVNYLLKPVGLGSQKPTLGSTHIESMLGKVHGAYIDLWGHEHKDGRLTAKTDSQDRAALAGEITGMVAGIAVPGGGAVVAMKAKKGAVALGSVAESGGTMQTALGTVLQKPIASSMTVVGVGELSGLITGGSAHAAEKPTGMTGPTPAPAP